MIPETKQPLIEANVHEKFSHSSLAVGLTEVEALQRFKKFGPNDLPSSKPKGDWKILFSVVKEPMIGLLLLCSGIYLVSGEPHESIPLLASIFFLIAISYVQQSKAERALDSLRSLASPRAIVIRDGTERRIPGTEVVPGDCILLREGDRVPADISLLEASNLKVDESHLTGESAAVVKQITPAADDVNTAKLFSGSLIVSGAGMAEVFATGMQTEIGKIGESLQQKKSEPSKLEAEVRSIVIRFGALGFSVSALLVLLYGLIYHAWGKGLLAGVALAMTLLPEEFPLVLTLFLSIGAWRISKLRVLTRELRAVETLGTVSVLCVDKTGTLTWNQLKITEVSDSEKSFPLGAASESLPESFREVVEYGVLASRADAFDPVDLAFITASVEHLASTKNVHPDWKLVREYPLTPELMAMACVWELKDRKQNGVAAKGAPEAIMDLCHLSNDALKKAKQQVQQMSAKGLKVLGVAKADFPSGDLPSRIQDFEFHFLGIVGLEDPLRAEVPSAISECQQAGIRLIMLTGDHSETAHTIANRAGIKGADQVLTGPELDALTDSELQEKVRTIGVFARVVPQHKLRIINALKKNGEVVGMTGDGVNDAPALKWADVGISMGSRGTDVAREASDLVLLDDDFASIVVAIRMGRRIFSNITRAMSYIFAVHVPIAGLAILPLLFHSPLILFPAHIVFMELIIDPASTLVFEAEEDSADAMTRPPRKNVDSPFGLRRIIEASFEGAIVLVTSCFAYFVGLKLNLPENQVRTLTFATLILGNLSLIFAHLNRHPITKSSGEKRTKWMNALRGHSKIVWGVTFGAIVFLLLIQHVPYFKRVFHVVSLGGTLWLIPLILAIVGYVGARSLQYAFKKRVKL